MKVSEIMTRDPLWVTPDCSLDEALVLLDDRGFRHLPVLQDGELVGVVSDRDLLEATGWLTSRVHAQRGPGMEEMLPKSVAAIMHRDVVSIRPSASLREAAIELFGRRIGCLPVLDRERLVGILTETDMLGAYARVFEQGKAPHNAYTDVESCMSRDTVTIEYTTPLEQALAFARSADVRHLPVLQRETLIGLVSDRDLRRAVGAGRHDETPVEEIMTWDLVTVAPSTPLHEAARIMVEKKLGALPVMEDEAMIGIVTSTDVLDRCLALFRDDQIVLTRS